MVQWYPVRSLRGFFSEIPSNNSLCCPPIPESSCLERNMDPPQRSELLHRLTLLFKNVLSLVKTIVWTLNKGRELRRGKVMPRNHQSALRLLCLQTVVTHYREGWVTDDDEGSPDRGVYRDELEVGGRFYWGADSTGNYQETQKINNMNTHACSDILPGSSALHRSGMHVASACCIPKRYTQRIKL